MPLGSVDTCTHPRWTQPATIPAEELLPLINFVTQRLTATPASAVSSPPWFVEAKVSAKGRMGTSIKEAVSIVRGSPLTVPLTVYIVVQSSLSSSRKCNGWILSCCFQY